MAAFVAPAAVPRSTASRASASPRPALAPRPDFAARPALPVLAARARATMDAPAAAGRPLAAGGAGDAAARQLHRVSDYVRAFGRAVPDLSDETLAKGATGRITVVGGSREYTGAPYFAAAAALRGGGELATVYCSEEAAGAIKAYSPELVVHPGLDVLEAGAREALGRAHVVVLGPGLGRGFGAGAVVRAVVREAARGAWPLVLDADALYFLAKDAELMKALRGGGGCVYLTPNAGEMARLCDAAGVDGAEALAAWFAHGGDARVVVVEKGGVDRVASVQGDKLFVADVRTSGAPKRCGGQGDVLCGLVGLFAGWAARDAAMRRVDSDEAGGADMMSVAAAVAACVTTRIAAGRSFAELGRAMLTSDLLDQVGPAFDVLAVQNSDF